MAAATTIAFREPARHDISGRGDNSVLLDLVARAKSGDMQAWAALIERYDPLVWSICRKHRFGQSDADDVRQSVWLRLVDQLYKLREPAALPGWITTTTRRECGRVIRAAYGPRAVVYALDADGLPDHRAETADQELLEAERRAAVREAFTFLPAEGQQLIAMLTADPPVPYVEISVRLGIPVGSIGPTRSRCLAKMRRHPAVAALANATSGPRRPVMAAAS